MDFEFLVIRGVLITFDAYPYCICFTILDSVAK